MEEEGDDVIRQRAKQEKKTNWWEERKLVCVCERDRERERERERDCETLRKR